MASSTPAALTPGQRLRRLPGALQQNTRNIQTSVRVVANDWEALREQLALHEQVVSNAERLR